MLRRRGQLMGRPWTRRALAAGMLPISLGYYESRMLSTKPVALWPLSEPAGAASVADVVASFAGTPSNVTLANATFPDGTPAPLFNGTSSYIDILTAAFVSAFTGGDEGSMAIWLRPNTGVLSDGAFRTLLVLRSNAQNFVTLEKSSLANAIFGYRRASNESRNAHTTTFNSAWNHLVFTWKRSSGRLYMYRNGVQIAGNTDSTQAFVGSLTEAYIGAVSKASLFWSGWLKYAAVWNRELTQSDVNALYVGAFAL